MARNYSIKGFLEYQIGASVMLTTTFYHTYNKIFFPVRRRSGIKTRFLKGLSHEIEVGRGGMDGQRIPSRGSSRNS
jgi:hypothetical protein